MRKILPIFLILVTSIFQFTYGQDSIPVLKGKVTLSIITGSIDCDFTLTNIPRLSDYVIRINSGMNIRYFKNLDANARIYYDKSLTDTFSTGETNAYFFPGNRGKGKFLPTAVQFRYVGMYPVVHDTIDDYSVEDWKGNIGFNGYSVRTDGRQSGWYPILYDIKRDVRYDQVKYDIEINCSDCNALYLNGSLPVSGNKAHFKSDIPRELTMYAGKYKIANVGSTYFLNPDITDQQLKEFGNMTNSYKKFYEQHLKIPYEGAITYIQTTPTSKDNAWLFVSYPTIVNIGYGEYGTKGIFNKKSGDWFKPYMAHELGHYYFGSYKIFNSALGDMMSEGFSEFLSLKLTKNLVSDSIYRKKISDKLRALKEFEATPIGKVRSKTDYQNRELYVYYYAPIVFLGIEKEIGEENMWKWIIALLQTKTELTNYQFMEQTLSTVLNDNQKLEAIKSKYFYSEKAIDNAANEINAQ